MTDTEEEKRIVLVGCPGSGKTMLAIGLYNKSERKGVAITVSDPVARACLSAFVADITTHKKFPQPTPLKKAQDVEETDRKRYPFEFVGWRGQRFTTVFEDYAGERASKAENEKEFDDIIGKNPYGAVLLLNPGMGLFKKSEDPLDIKKRTELPKLYKTMLDRLLEKGCKHFVLAITASDRISRGGDLCKTEQHKNFKEVLKEIEDYLKAVKQTKEGREVYYKVVPVTVTGRLNYNDKGDAEEEHLAKDSENTAADPFLWIIDPWRLRIRKLLKVLVWSALASGAFFWILYAGFRTWHGCHIKNYLNDAESALGNFGDPTSDDFDSEGGKEKLGTAEANLKKVNDAWFVGDADRRSIDERLPGLLGTLMTNQVLLAYKNLSPRGDEYIGPNRTLEGCEELNSWRYWERSMRGKEVHDAAVVFRDGKTDALREETIKSNAKYLAKESIKPEGKCDDDTVSCFFGHIGECLMLAKGPQLVRLKDARDAILAKWVDTVVKSEEVKSQDVASRRVNAVIPDDIGLDKDRVLGRIWAGVLKRQKGRAVEKKNKILDERNDLSSVASLLFEYLSDAQNSDSPYKWLVLNAAKIRFNSKVSRVLDSFENRKEGFEAVFQATRKLHSLDSALLNEGTFGDNALYWLNPTNNNGTTCKTSRDWLRYRFQCDAVAVCTDHQVNNPTSVPFKHKVDANLIISFDQPQANFPRRIGSDWLITNEEGEKEWTKIPSSAIDVYMAATDVLQITVLKGEEDWKYDVDIPELRYLFMPGWGDKRFWEEYESKKDVYPNKARYYTLLWESRCSGGPRKAFEQALNMAKSREDGIAEKMKNEIRKANEELKLAMAGGMAMSEKLHLDQVFYGAGPAGYGILATSFAEEALAQAAVNACLAIGLVPGSGLVKSILLSRILGDRIVMARICNGAKDTSGRNTLFIHALVASVQEVRSARVSTFSLADAAIFCNRISDSSAKPLLVDAGHSVGAETHETLELPAAIMTPEPDEEIMRRVVHGRENLLSWSTFAFDDMQGYDVICLSPLVSSPVGRNIYDSDLRLICGVTVKRNASASVSPPHVDSCPPLRNPKPKEGVRKRRNGLLIPLLLSVSINVVLLAIFALSQTKDAMQGAGIVSKPQSNEIVVAAKREFLGKKAVTDDMLEKRETLSSLYNSVFAPQKTTAKFDEDVKHTFRDLLAYRDFVEITILQRIKPKEK